MKDCGYIGSSLTQVVKHLAWVHGEFDKSMMSYIQEHGLEGSNAVQRLVLAVKADHMADDRKQQCEMCERMCNSKYADSFSIT